MNKFSGKKRKDFTDLWVVYPAGDKIFFVVSGLESNTRIPDSNIFRYFDNYWEAKAYYLKLMEEKDA